LEQACSHGEVKQRGGVVRIPECNPGSQSAGLAGRFSRAGGLFPAARSHRDDLSPSSSLGLRFSRRTNCRE
jgi:hypothetical protein